MKVIGLDPYVKNIPAGVEMVSSLAELLPRADVLALHCPLTKETKGMIGAKELAALPKSAIVLNTARGGIVDERALAAAIEARKIFGAGIDDFEAEPIAADHPFNKLSHVVMTPHVGASTQEALDTVSVMSVDNAMNFLNHAPFDLKLCVNPSTLNKKATVSA
jgi:D-3-phosphoglycerate dehydrogenase